MPRVFLFRRILSRRTLYHGYLWDLDKCNENGELYGEGDIPCPFCNIEEFIEHDPFSKEYEFYEGIEDEEKAKEKAREWYLSYIDKLRERYG